MQSHNSVELLDNGDSPLLHNNRLLIVSRVVGNHSVKVAKYTSLFDNSEAQ